ncbi:TPA: YbeD family protein [Pasteurella multocida]|nr:YbeD family protein [Pasteurella multocida]HDR1547542.1 YbeD family protein [Pasteurella multocida]HDR1884910.1 YbeD family protein [Pasteurella multocida]HED4407325.1 YbeD family protein [Pasteurella multocida]
MTEKIIKLNEIPQAKLKDLLEFPCAFTFKVVGANRADLIDDVVVVVQKYAKGDYNPRQQLSSKGTYNSVSIDIIAEHIEQVEVLYVELAKIDGVRMVL